MKKSLFALAALGAFAGAAQAQSSVSIYGNLDATEAYQSAGGLKSYALTASANSTSLWGLKGSEDMGGGMKMGFDLKSELNLATGQTGSGTNVPPTSVITTTNAPTATAPLATGYNSNLFNRGANIFISTASMGEVKVGRMDDIEWAMSGTFSTSGSNSFGSNQGHAQITNIANTGLGVCNSGTKGVAGGGVCTTMGYTAQNYSYQGTADAFMAGIQYTTPNFAGFTVKIQNGLGANSGIDTVWAGNTMGAGVFYSGMGGNLDLAVAQSRRTDATGNLGFTITSAGAKYKVMPALTLTGLYTITGLSGDTVAAIGTSGANAGNTMWSAGVNYQVTPAADVSLSYTAITGDTSPTASSSSNGSIAGSANSVNLIGLTGRYNFSKRTAIYAGVGQANNSGAYFMSPIYGGVAMNTGTIGNNGIGGNIFAGMLGLRHQF